MAIYILVLSVVPCSDIHNACNKENSKTELSQNHDHQQDQDDNCTPFALALVVVLRLSVLILPLSTNQTN